MKMLSLTNNENSIKILLFAYEILANVRRAD